MRKNSLLKKSGAAVFLACVVFGMMGCAGSETELRAWMEQQRREVSPSVQPLEPPKQFDPQPYLAQHSVDPFNRQKLIVALRQEARNSNSLIAGELNRRKEVLEAFPIDSMTMVGTLTKRGAPEALIKVNELLYQVKVGSHIGQNSGKILSINESQINYREFVMDSNGKDWTERHSTLHLQVDAQ